MRSVAFRFTCLLAAAVGCGGRGELPDAAPQPAPDAVVKQEFGGETPGRKESLEVPLPPAAERNPPSPVEPPHLETGSREPPLVTDEPEDAKGGVFGVLGRALIRAATSTETDQDESP